MSTSRDVRFKALGDRTLNHTGDMHLIHVDAEPSISLLLICFKTKTKPATEFVIKDALE